MSMKERLEKWRALWAKLTAEAEDEEYQDAATVICDRCGGRADADCAACPVRTGRPLHLQTDPDAALAPMPVMVPMKILDAAIEDLKCFSECEQCAHCDSENYQVCESADCVCDGCPDHSCPCYDCGHGSKWVWRGPRQKGYKK